MGRIFVNRIAARTAFALLVVLATACSRLTGGSGPTDADIEKLLKAHYTDTTYATRTYRLSLDEVQRADSREGDHWADGTPANKDTTVYPCKVKFTRVTSYSTDNSVVTDHFTSDYVFFKDEFGDWTYRVKNESSQRG